MEFRTLDPSTGPSVEIPAPSLIPVLSLQKYSTLLWATSKDKLYTLQPGVSKEGSGVCYSQHLPIPGRTGDSDCLALTVVAPAHSDPFTDPTSAPCCVPPGSAAFLGSLVQLPRKPSGPAKFSLLPKGHKVAAPLGHSIQVVASQPTGREKIPDGLREVV